MTALLATVLVVTQSKDLDPTLATAGLVLNILVVGLAAVLSMKAKPSRAAFSFLILASLVNVVLLMLGTGL
jgi:uncharacterized membrane protein YczE